MDDLIAAYLRVTYTAEMIDVITECFTILEQHGHTDPYFQCVDLLAKDLDTSSKADLFLAQVIEMIDELLMEYTIKTTTETDLTTKVQILQAIATFSDLEDPTPVLVKLESMSSNEEKLAFMVAQHSDLDESDVMLAVEEFNSELLEATKKLLYKQEEAKHSDNSEQLLILNRLRIFSQQYPQAVLGVEMVKAGVLVGMPFENYLVFIEEDFISNDVDTTALNVLSVILMSENGFDNTIQIYRKFSMKIFTDVRVATEVESHLQKFLSDYNEYLKFNHEKTSSIKEDRNID